MSYIDILLFVKYKLIKWFIGIKVTCFIVMKLKLFLYFCYSHIINITSTEDINFISCDVLQFILSLVLTVANYMISKMAILHEKLQHDDWLLHTSNNGIFNIMLLIINSHDGTEKGTHMRACV